MARDLTIEEAAQALGLTPGTLRSQIMKGRLHATKIGRRLNLIAPQEVERYRREHLGQFGPKGARAGQAAKVPCDEGRGQDSSGA